MKGRFLFLTIIALTALSTLPATHLRAQGYDGVIAPEDGTETNAAADDGYEGVIAPSDNARASKAGSSRDSIAKDTGKMTDMPNRENSMTRIGSQYQDSKLQNSQQLKGLAMHYGVDKNGDNIPDKMANRFRLTNDVTQALNRPRARIDGLLPKSHGVQVSLDAIYEDLKKVPVAERGAAAKQWIVGLKTMRDGLMAKKSTSVDVYKVMGLPDIYIKEEREDTNYALDRVNDALKTLEKY